MVLPCTYENKFSCVNSLYCLMQSVHMHFLTSVMGRVTVLSGDSEAD